VEGISKLIGNPQTEREDMKVQVKCYCGRRHYVEVGGGELDNFSEADIPCPDCEEKHYQWYLERQRNEMGNTLKGPKSR